MTNEEKENIKYRLSDIGKQVGSLALEYISELEKENAELKENLKNYVEGYGHLISTYKEQIALMRCCGNCINRIDGQEFKDGCKVNWNCEKYNNWGLENER